MKQLDNQELTKFMGGGDGRLTQSTYTSAEPTVIRKPDNTTLVEMDAKPNNDDVY